MGDDQGECNGNGEGESAASAKIMEDAKQDKRNDIGHFEVKGKVDSEAERESEREPEDECECNGKSKRGGGCNRKRG